jgi:hypothetical protein
MLPHSFGKSWYPGETKGNQYFVICVSFGQMPYLSLIPLPACKQKVLPENR